MKKVEIIIASILFIVFSCLLGIRFIAYLRFKNRYKLTKEELVLYDNVKKMHSALTRGNDSLLFRMFNQTFIKEVEFEDFSFYLDNWRNNRTVRQVKMQHIEIMGRGGHVTSWVTFHNRQKFFLFQSWINTKKGWKILWLNKALPNELFYGQPNEKELRKLKLSVLHELITNQNIQRITGNLPLPDTLIVIQPDDMAQSRFHIEGYEIIEMSKSDIKSHVGKINAPFYLEFATIRIVDDIATCYIDVHPLYKFGPPLDRTRGLQFYFIWKNNRWEFDSQGSKW